MENLDVDFVKVVFACRVLSSLRAPQIFLVMSTTNFTCAAEFVVYPYVKRCEKMTFSLGSSRIAFVANQL